MIDSPDKSYVLKLVDEEHLKNALEKMLLQITGSGIYQDMLQPEDNVLLPEVLDEDGIEILSDTVLWYLLPIQVRQII